MPCPVSGDLRAEKRTRRIGFGSARRPVAIVMRVVVRPEDIGPETMNAPRGSMVISRIVSSAMPMTGRPSTTGRNVDSSMRSGSRATGGASGTPARRMAWASSATSRDWMATLASPPCTATCISWPSRIARPGGEEESRTSLAWPKTA